MKTVIWNITYESPHNDCVIGDFIVDGKPEMLLCGLPYRNNERNVSRLPNGIYFIKPHNSPHHGFCYKVYWADVEGNLVEPDGRTDIEIHSANHAGHLDGCMCPGLKYGVFTKPYGDNDEQEQRIIERLQNQSYCDEKPLNAPSVNLKGLNGVTSSREAFGRLRGILGDKDAHRFIIAENYEQ